MVTETTERLWSIEETARYLGISKHTLYQWRARGAGPPGLKIGRYVRFRPEDVRAWEETQRR